MHSVLVKCESCNDLSILYKKIECSILYMIQRKHAIQKYNLEDNLNQEKWDDLVRYKRIIGNRIYDCSYPSDCIKTSSIIEKASQLAFKEDNCSQCELCNQ